MANPYYAIAVDYMAPYQDWFPITPGTAFTNTTRAIRATGAGTVTLTTVGGGTRTMAFAAGETRSVACTAVASATATGLEGAW